jgi:leucyl-tRNA synthetase
VQTDEQGNTICRTDAAPVNPVRIEADQVEKRGDVFVLKSDPNLRVESRAHKMSKSRGNVVNPDEIVREYGADSLRLYEMFMGPLEATKPWSMSGVDGVHKFLERVWRLIIDDKAEPPRLNKAVQDVAPTDEQDRMLHKTIKAVTLDIESLSFNTAIARMMEFVNFYNKQPVRPRSALQTFLLLLSPMAPHLAEELWQQLGHSQTLAYEPWPVFDEDLTVEETIEVPVQVRGKLRSRIRVPADASREDLEAAARADDKIAQLLHGQQVLKTIVVPGRLVNFVTRS